MNFTADPRVVSPIGRNVRGIPVRPEKRPFSLMEIKTIVYAPWLKHGGALLGACGLEQ